MYRMNSNISTRICPYIQLIDVIFVTCHKVSNVFVQPNIVISLVYSFIQFGHHLDFGKSSVVVSAKRASSGLRKCIYCWFRDSVIIFMYVEGLEV